jgi:hypothetical protein
VCTRKILLGGALNDNFNCGCRMALKGNAEGSVKKYVSRNDSVQEIIRKELCGVFGEKILYIVSIYIHTRDSGILI